MKETFKKYVKYLIAPLIVFILMMIIYMIKEITPFGNNNIINADLGQSYISVYYYLRSIFFNNKSFLWSFNFASGYVFEWISASNGLFCPLSWVLAFIKPDNLVAFTPMYLVIKMMLLALSFNIFVSKAFKRINFKYDIILSIMYAFSGYVILSYHNIIWLDSLVYYPLLVLATLNIFKNKKIIPFIILFTLTLINSFYIGYMVALSIIIIGALYIHYFVDKNEKKEIKMLSLCAVFVSCIISLPVIMPVLIQTPKSYRYLYIANQTPYNDLLTKVHFYLIQVILLIIPFIKLYKDSINNKKKSIGFWTFTLISLTVGIFIEKINLSWHGGSYVMFPYRYGFIPLFFLLTLFASYINNYYKENKEKINTINLIIGIILIVLSVLTIYKQKNIILNTDIIYGINKNIFKEIFKYVFILIVSYAYLLTIRNSKLRNTFLIVLLFIEITSNTILYVGRINDNISNYDYRTTLLTNAENIKKEFNLKDNFKLDRYKDTTALVNENYALALDVPTIAGWAHLADKNNFLLHQLMGYSVRYTRKQDLGGTLFSDAINHIKYVFSNDDLSENVYELLDEHDGVKLYKKNTLPFGIIHNNKTVTLDSTNPFDFQNGLYRAMFNKEDNILEKLDANFKLVDNSYYEATINTQNNINLYIYSLGGYASKILINDEIIYAPYVGNPNNTSYPVTSNNGILDLKEHIGKINIKIYGNISNFDLRYISVDKYNDLVDNYNNDIEYTLGRKSIDINVTGADDKYLFMSIPYYDGIKTYVNGKEVSINAYLGNYINIPLTSGVNKIHIDFNTLYFNKLIIVSITVIIMIVAFTYINKRVHFNNNKILLNIANIIFNTCVIIVIIYVYIYALIK